MSKYLNPKSDRTFKKVFGEHKELPSMITALYGYPQCLMNDRYVVKFLHEHGDTMPIESILYSIDKYWDQVSRERTALNAAERKGRSEEKSEIAKNLKDMGMNVAIISKATGLTAEEINAL